MDRMKIEPLHLIVMFLEFQTFVVAKAHRKDRPDSASGRLSDKDGKRRLSSLALTQRIIALHSIILLGENNASPPFLPASLRRAFQAGFC